MIWGKGHAPRAPRRSQNSRQCPSPPLVAQKSPICVAARETPRLPLQCPPSASPAPPSSPTPAAPTKHPMSKRVPILQASPPPALPIHHLSSPKPTAKRLCLHLINSSNWTHKLPPAPQGSKDRKLQHKLE